jgi:hypothetical protein
VRAIGICRHTPDPPSRQAQSRPLVRPPPAATFIISTQSARLALSAGGVTSVQCAQAGALAGVTRNVARRVRRPALFLGRTARDTRTCEPTGDRRVHQAHPPCLNRERRSLLVHLHRGAHRARVWPPAHPMPVPCRHAAAGRCRSRSTRLQSMAGGAVGISSVMARTESGGWAVNASSFHSPAKRALDPHTWRPGAM